MFKLELDGKWRFRKVGDAGWTDARVPGSVFNDLLEAGLIEDPFYRENEHKAKEIAAHDYEYVREFTADGVIASQQRVVLVCEGLDTLADVYLNDAFVGHADNMHRIWEFDIKGMLRAGRNTIRIVFHSPTAYIEKKQAENPLWGSEDTMKGFPHIRKCHSMFGWDWGPQIPDSGIWRSIYILAGRTERLSDVYVTQEHSGGKVRLDVRVRVECGGGCCCSKDTLADGVSAADGMMPGSKRKLWLRALLAAPDGSASGYKKEVRSSEERISIDIDKPELWWPNGYGGQPLYGLSVELVEEPAVPDMSPASDMLPECDTHAACGVRISGCTETGCSPCSAQKDCSILDSRSYRIGLRTISIRREKDQWGESFGFVVNGVPIFATGANYIPEDSLLSRCSRERTEKLIQSCVRANFNMIRVWGGGHYPHDFFYDLCDEHGILVWQDFMFACAVYELTDEFAESIRKEAEDNIKRLRHHASLAIWCGNNEMEVAWVHWGFPKTEKHRRHYLAMFEQILPEAVAEHDPATFYWPSSPSSGGGFDDPNSEDRGDVHYWDVWHGLKPFADYRKFYFRFVSEFGFQSFPGIKTVKTFTLPEDRNIFSYVMENHQKNGAANGKILYYLSENFKYPKDFESLLITSQLLQAEAIKCGVEHWRRNRGRCMGAIYWQLNDCWPVASWSSIDYYGRWKALHYFARRFFAPVMISADEDGSKVSLHVCNETMADFRGEVRWQLRDASSKVIRSGCLDAGAGPLASEEVCRLDFSDELGSREKSRSVYLEYSLYSGGECISGGTLLFVRNKHFGFIDPRIRADVTEETDRFVIRLNSSAFAKYVALDLADADCIFSDNYFDLSAGYEKVVSVKKSDMSKQLGLEDFKAMLQVRSIYDLA